MSITDQLPGPGDPAPAQIANAAGTCDLVLVCDHAARAIPRGLGDLGLQAGEIDLHIGWDIGALAVAKALSRALDAPLVWQAYSRLVIDCNRPPEHPTCIPSVSDGVAIPANADLSPAARRSRVEAIHRPYHAAIAACLDGRAGRRSILVAVHSFTPVMGGTPRPWRFGVLHDGSSPFSRAVLVGLQRRGEAVGDNQPYSLEPETDFTVPTHAQGRGLDYLELEIRQDLIAGAAGAATVARMLEEVLREALAG